MTKALAITVDRNTPGRMDWQGAFKPESIKFSRFYGVAEGPIMLSLGVGKPARRARMVEVLNARPGVEVLGLMMHGLRRSIPQFGWDLSNVGELAAAIHACLAPGGVMALYACSAGTGVGEGPGGEGGFADALRDALVALGRTSGHLDAHERAAHTTCNPYVRRFDFSANVLGGEWLIAPGSPEWKAWAARLNERDDLRFRFPAMTADQIREELRCKPKT